MGNKFFPDICMQYSRHFCKICFFHKAVFPYITIQKRQKRYGTKNAGFNHANFSIFLVDTYMIDVNMILKIWVDDVIWWRHKLFPRFRGKIDLKS